MKSQVPESQAFLMPPFNDDLTPTGREFLPIDEAVAKMRILEFNTQPQILIFGHSDPRTLEPAVLRSIIRNQKKKLFRQV